MLDRFTMPMTQRPLRYLAHALHHRHITPDQVTLAAFIIGICALPLLAFAGAARRLRLATLGFLMYINPSIQFGIALLVFHEPLAPLQLTSFLLIWVGLALYSWSAWTSRARTAPAVASQK